MTDEEIVTLVEGAKSELKTELLERIEKVETTLLKEFRKRAFASKPASVYRRLRL